MLVWVASYPRSGNTFALLTLQDVLGERRIGSVFQDDLWLGYLVHELVPGSAEPWEPPPELRSLRGAELLGAIRERPEPYFVKTHRLSEVEDPAPALYIVRDGRDAIVSHAHFVADRGTPRFRGLDFDQRLEQLIRPGVPAYGHWSRNVRGWRRRDAPTSTIHFEQLLQDPAGTIAAALKRLDVAVGDARADAADFADLRERAPVMFRRGVLGAWSEEMNPRLQRLFWRTHGETMRSSATQTRLRTACSAAWAVKGDRILPRCSSGSPPIRGRGIISRKAPWPNCSGSTGSGPFTRAGCG